jgi:plastocyanin
MTHLRLTRTALILALVGAVTLVASACGSSSGAGSSATTVTEAAGGGGGATSGKTIDVTLKDFSIAVASTGSLAPGTYTFHVTNNGPSSHNLTINGPGVSDKATPTFAAGGSMDLTATLENGSYELFCSVPGHKQLGMDTHLTVGSGGGAAGGGSTNGGGSTKSGSTASGGGWA